MCPQDHLDIHCFPIHVHVTPAECPLLQTTGTKQPSIVKWLDSITDAWHVVVPVVDDVTDVLLLTSTADSSSPLWWICLVALVVADMERLWLFFTLCLTTVLLPLLRCVDLYQLAVERGDVFVGSQRGYEDGRPARLFARLNCRPDAPRNTFLDRLKDSLLWVVVGSRSRCSPLWGVVGMSLDAKVQEADHAGVAFGAIDKWVARHPFSFVGQCLFGKDFALKGGNDGASRRARVMIRAVGETLVVDTLFLALSVVSGGWDEDLTGVAGISALFSVLELLTELQYYVAEAGAVLEPVSSSDTTAPVDLERGTIRPVHW